MTLLYKNDKFQPGYNHHHLYFLLINGFGMKYIFSPDILRDLK